MGRKKLYHTPEERLNAKRLSARKSYQKKKLINEEFNRLLQMNPDLYTSKKKLTDEDKQVIKSLLNLPLDTKPPINRTTRHTNSIAKQQLGLANTKIRNKERIPINTLVYFSIQFFYLLERMNATTTTNKQSDFDYFISHLKLNECKKPNKFFKRATFNGINVYVELDESGRIIRFNITKLFKALNLATKTASSGASSFVKQNIISKGWIDTFPNKFHDVKGKGTQEFKGLYVDIHDLEKWLIPINGLHAYRWFIDDDAWFESLGKGYVYLIKVPKHHGTNIFKYGRTINMNQRWIVYLNATPAELQALGIEILAFAYVDNQSEAEDAIAKAFDNENYTSTEDGREYRMIDNSEDPYAVAFSLFYDALTGIGVDIESIETFNEGTNFYRYKRDSQ